MKCIKTYEYILSEDEIKRIIADSFNNQQTKHLPITKANVRIDIERPRYQEVDPEIHAVIEIEEGGN